MANLVKRKPKTKVRIPRNRILTPQKNKTNRSKRKKDKRKVVRGKEISVNESSSERQLIYGRMKVGGVITFIETSADSHAYLLTGTSNSQLVWYARSGGTGGNSITITIVKPGGTNGTLTVGVVGNDITVTVKTSAGSSLSTASQVITAVRASSAANALVSISLGDGDGTAHVGAAAQAPLQNGGGTWLHTVHTLAGHEIDAIESLHIDNRQVTFGGTPDPRWGSGIWNNKIFMAFIAGTDTQEAQPDLMAQLPAKWTSNHRQLGCAGAYIINIWNENLYAQGFPATSFIVRGKKVYDPRTLATAWSNNGALCVADLLNNPIYGFGIDYADIDTTALSAAADICDEDVPLAAGGTEKRYTVNGVADFGDPDRLLTELLTAIDGEVVESAGKYFIYAGAYRTPTITLTKDDLRGPIQLTTHVSRSDNFNAVRATYVDPNSDYKETDAPIVKNSTYISEDGLEIFQDLALNWVTSSSQAQRLMKIDLEKVRQGQTLVLPLKASGLLIQGKDTVMVTIPELGFSSKVFEVRELDVVIESDGSIGVDMTGRETASGIWTWSAEETTVDLAPDTDLPDPTSVEAPTNVTLTSGTSELYIRQDGAVFSRLKVAWTPTTTEFVTAGGSYQIQYKQHGTSTWSIAVEIPGYMEFYHILDVQDGTAYDVRIRAVNTLDYGSDWVEVDNHTVVGKTEPPSDVTNLAASVNNFGVLILCDEIPDLDADLYEFRVGTGGETWDDATLIGSSRSTSFNWKYQIAGDYTLMAKALDTTGNYSANAATFALSLTAPNAPTVTVALSGRNVRIAWTAPTSLFAVKEYEIRYGVSYAAGTSVVIITGLNTDIVVDWGGSRTFWVAARDIAGNTGAAGSASITIANPNDVENFVPTVTGNNVLLDWDQPDITSLPIAAYFVYKGSVLATAELLGIVTGTFNTYVERTGGTFTYWIVVQDSAGNLSAGISNTLVVSEPDNFFIRDDSSLTDYATFSKHAIKGGSYYAQGEDADSWFFPIPSSTVSELSLPLAINNATESFESWATHFTTYPTMAAMLAAGYTHFLMPATTDPGYVEYFFDYGVTFDQSFIDFTYSVEVLGGSVVITPSIQTSPDGVTWTSFAAAQAFGLNFRYVKYRVDFTAADDKSLVRFYDARARISLKIEDEYDQVSAVSTDVGGTLVTFVKDFLDIRDIQATPQTALAYYVVTDWADVPNPVSFKVLLFDKDGNRVSGPVSYHIIGAVNPS